jgi:competence protein ComEA
MNVPSRLWTHRYQYIAALILSGLSVQVLAEKFDQRYLDWKAKQQAIDAKLMMNAAPKNSQPMAQVVSTGSKVRLNSASVPELMQLNGVGEKKAQAIVEYRQQHGGFQEIEDIQKVKGIGPALFEKNKARLAL